MVFKIKLLIVFQDFNFLSQVFPEKVLFKYKKMPRQKKPNQPTNPQKIPQKNQNQRNKKPHCCSLEDSMGEEHIFGKLTVDRNSNWTG